MAVGALLPIPQNSTTTISVTASSANTYIDTTAQTVNLVNLLIDNAGGNVAFVNWNISGAATASVTASIPVLPNSSRTIYIKSGAVFDSNIGVAANAELDLSTVIAAFISSAPPLAMIKSGAPRPASVCKTTDADASDERRTQ